MNRIDFRLNPPIDSPALNALYAASWPRHKERDDWPELAHSLVHIWAWDSNRLAGFVYAAWDGDVHAFLLDPTVHPDYRRQGLGLALVKQAEEAARNAGCEWLHVDYEDHLEPFYRAAGFRPTQAGLIHLWD